MLRALYSAAAGMESQQMNLDVISNNLANVNTTGFKKSKVEFQELLYQTTRAPGADLGSGNQLPTGIQVGQGSRPVATARIFTNGDLTHTAYTRDGAFKTDSTGRIVTSDGLPVIGGFQPVPAGTTNITISSNGNITYTGASGSTTFQAQLVRFNNPAGLESEGSNLYKESPASGTPELGTPGQNGFGTLNQGYLELSNVSVVEEMVNLIQAQRAYEVNSKAVQAADEMMQQSNNMKR
jgi:flagellar basal-body rod protein FlgG